MKIYTISTFLDWVAFYGSWGEPGVEKVFDYLKIAKVERVYWRVLDGGRATYPSKVAPIFKGTAFTDQVLKGDGGGPLSYRSMKPTRFDVWDSLASAVRIGHQRGIEVCAWFTVYEEDHGGNLGSKLAGRNDLCQQDRNGVPHPGAIELFFKEVQDYKLKIVRELLARDVDGILLDFVRHNATPSADTNGIHRFGYNPAIRRAFQRVGGRDPLAIRSDDPSWLAFKNRYQTDFVRRIRHLIGNRKRMDLMLWPVDNYRWLCLDLPSLSREKQVDLVASFSMNYSFSPHEMRRQYRCMQSQVRGSHTEIAVGVQGYFGIDPEEFEGAVAAAEKAGATSVLFYEANHMAGSRTTTSIRAIHLNAPRKQREVRVRSLPRAPRERDWQRAGKCKGFFIIAGADRTRPTAVSEFSILKSPHAIHCRLVAHGAQSTPNLAGVYSGGARSSDEAILQGKKPFLDALGARMYWLGADRGHFLLDVGRTRRGFTHFVVGLNGDRLQQTSLDNSWSANWDGRSVRVSAKKWIAEWSIPFRTLGETPRKGDRWGFQVYREQAATHEVSCWFVSTTDSCDGLRSHEWGDLVFE